MGMYKKLSTVAIALSFLLSAAVQAGQCDVKVSWPGGSPRGGAKVVGSVNSGGMTGAVYSNNKGRARLRWGGDNGLSKDFVNGSAVASCRNGGSVRIVQD